MKVSDFSLVEDDADRDDLLALLKSFHDRPLRFPRDASVHAIFTERAARMPDAIAVQTVEHSISYGDLDRLSNRIAHTLLADGIQPETIIGVMLDDAILLIASFLGVLKAGAAYCPIDAETPFERIRYMLDDTAAPLLISERRHMRRINRLQWECRELRTVLVLDSDDALAEPEVLGEKMKREVWDYVGETMFDDISGGGWQSSFTGEWLSREVMDDYGRNARLKLAPLLPPEARVLEIGCASGITMFQVAPLVAEYVGTDMSPEILRWTEQEVARRGAGNIWLYSLAAHEIDALAPNELEHYSGRSNLPFRHSREGGNPEPTFRRLPWTPAFAGVTGGDRKGSDNALNDGGFDVVIINSVAQCFSGHNYLRDVLRKAVALTKNRGLIFLGNVFDQDLQDAFLDELQAFQRAHAGTGFRTKTDYSEELFVNRAFLNDLRHELPEIAGIECSPLLGTHESELSRFSFDAILRIDKSGETAAPLARRHKRQLDRRALNAASDMAAPAKAGAHSLAYVMYTSGTSGRPKGALIEHRAILRLGIEPNFVELGPDTRILMTGAVAFDASTFEIWGALLNGGTLVRAPVMALLEPGGLKALIREYRVSTMWLTASLFNQIVETDIAAFDGLRHLLIGGEKLSPRHVGLARRAHPALALINGYGPTENTTFTACHRIVDSGDGDIPIGRPIRGTEILIVDPAGQPVPIGIAGEIWAAGDGMARGYLNDAQLTAERFVAHPLHPGERAYRTGDRGRWTDAGLVEFLGRIDDQAKIRGYRVEPAEIEHRIAESGGVADVVVLCRETSEGLELVAYVTGAVDAAVLRAALKTKLPDYMVPARIVVLERLPLNANGKVDRRELLRQSGRPATNDIASRPLNETELVLTGIWEEVLGTSGIGAEENFFDVGGHSLKVTKLVAAIQQRLGVTVPLAAVFRRPTVRGFTRYLLDIATIGVPLADEIMVPLGGPAGAPPVFVLPPGTGDVLSYIPLADPDPDAAYRLFAFNFIEADTRFADYADLIEQTQPEGACVLLGYSSGGNLAFHLAVELERRGRVVSDIVMLDSGRRLAPYPYLHEAVMQVAADFLAHDSIAPYCATPVLRDKIIRRIVASHRFLAQSGDDGRISANIHVLLCGDPVIEHAIDGRTISSIEAWREVTSGHFRLYPGVGEHTHMLLEPALAPNLRALRAILAECGR